MEDGEERSALLLSILRSFHSYLLKYTDMVKRGHVPVYRGAVSPDSSSFLRLFLRAGEVSNRATLQAACRTLHLAFSQQHYDEVYNIMAGLLMKVINSYDPRYTDKVKLVVEAIAGRADQDSVIVGPELELDFDPRRFLRWMTRNGLLEAIRDPQDKRGRIVGFRLAAWPPKASLLSSKPIGLAYHVQKWFGHYVQAYITSKMKEVEAKHGTMQLEHRRVQQFWAARRE